MVSYAGFGARLGALIVDGLVIGIPFAIIGGLAFWGLSEDGPCTTSFDSDFGTTYSTCRNLTGGGAAVFALLMLVLFVAALVYYIRPVATGGQTVGMKAANIRVVDADTGGPIGLGRAVVRYLVRSFISGIVCYLGYLWMLWDDRSQTWHDKAANSIVVRTA
jgi:uncharacterized RDD family membrane protein YckC